LRINWLQVEGFRNLETQRIPLSSPATLLHGRNAQGKTNILEAIYLLATTRSFRDNRPESLIRHERAQAALLGEVEHEEVRHELGISLSGRGKSFHRDGRATDLATYVRTLPVVVLSAEDRGLVSGVPRYRRDFLDAAGVFRRAAYLETLLAFGRSRLQRNLILRDYQPGRSRELEAWTETYASLGQEIQKERAAVTESVNAVLGGLQGGLGLDERVRMAYRPSGGEDLREALRRARAEEIRRGASQVGPQRDRVEILLDGRPIQSFGSSGQSRTALWLLKLARVQLLSERESRLPLFLLDEVEAELDPQRLGQMMRLTQGRAQVVMTATRPLDASWGDLAYLRVEAGRVLEGA
jgi:DNA replication and repair protein RecF